MTRATYEAMHREIKDDGMRKLLEATVEAFDFNAAETQKLIDKCPFLRVDDDNVVQGPW